MKVIKQEKISFPGKEVNEDVATICKSSAWVLDGATGLNKKNQVSKDSDAKWFVEQWNQYLLDNISNKELNLKEIIKEGIIKVKNLYYSIVNKNDIEPIDIPSSGISLIRWQNSKIEYLVLGDCTFIFKKRNEVLKQHKDNKLEELDSQVISYINSIMIDENISMLEARERAKNKLINNRLLKNTKGGYWILGLNDIAADKSIYGTIDVDDDIEILLATDGFSCIFDRYHYINKSEIFKTLEKTTLKSIYNKLREIENEDESCLQYPRLKKSDDSSAIYIKLSN